MGVLLPKALIRRQPNNGDPIINGVIITCLNLTDKKTLKYLRLFASFISYIPLNTHDEV